MTTPAEDLSPLSHMLEVSEWILSIVEGRTQSDLAVDLQLFLALSRAIEIVGEAANRVSDTTQSRTPEILWRRIIGMRNHLAHRYDNIDDDTLWRTARDSIPTLIENVRRLIPDDFVAEPLR